MPSLIVTTMVAKYSYRVAYKSQTNSNQALNGK